MVEERVHLAQSRGEITGLCDIVKLKQVECMRDFAIAVAMRT